MGFPRQEYWSGLLFPSSGDLPDPGIEPASPALAGGSLTTEPPGKPQDKELVEYVFNGITLAIKREKSCHFQQHG